MRPSLSATTPSAAHAAAAAQNERSSEASLAATSATDEWKMIALYQTREAELRERAERASRHAQQTALMSTLDEQRAAQRRHAQMSGACHMRQ
jgi:hypothetical protein